jgi:hypothetical protein
MKVVLKDGDTFDVQDFKAVRGGIVLFERADREGVLGYIPSDQLQYVLTDELARERGIGQQATARQQQIGGARAGQPSTIGQQQPHTGARSSQTDVQQQQPRTDAQQQPQMGAHQQQPQTGSLPSPMGAQQQPQVGGQQQRQTGLQGGPQHSTIGQQTGQQQSRTGSPSPPQETQQPEQSPPVSTSR